MLFDELHSSSPPPPAYELTEQEYDQKVSVVVERSRVEASSSAVARQDDELWEIWDEAAFEAAAARTTVSNSSSSAQTDSLTKADRKRDTGKSTDPCTAPLRIVKKRHSSIPSTSPPSKEKERPSWYAEAQLSPTSVSSTSHGRIPSGRRPLPVAPTILPVAEDREPTPPPMFEPVGPSLDGPPYEPAAPPGSIMLTYVPGGSRPTSPLQSPTFLQPQPLDFHRSHLIPSSLCPGSVSPAPSVHPATLRPASRSPRPPSMSTRSSFVSGPRVPFNPQVAYTKRPLFDVPAEESLPRNADASALYNSAVSSHIPGRAARNTTHKSAPRPTSILHHPIPTRVSPIPFQHEVPPLQTPHSESTQTYGHSTRYSQSIPAQSYPPPNGQFERQQSWTSAGSDYNPQHSRPW